MSGDNPLIPLRVVGRDMPVYQSGGHVHDGIAFGVLGDEVFVTISRGGRAFYVRLSGEEIDAVAGLLADAVFAATRAEAPTRGTVQ